MAGSAERGIVNARSKPNVSLVMRRSNCCTAQQKNKPSNGGDFVPHCIVLFPCRTTHRMVATDIRRLVDLSFPLHRSGVPHLQCAFRDSIRHLSRWWSDADWTRVNEVNLRENGLVTKEILTMVSILVTNHLGWALICSGWSNRPLDNHINRTPTNYGRVYDYVTQER